MISHILAILADHCSHAKIWLMFWLTVGALFFQFNSQKWLCLPGLTDWCGCSKFWGGGGGGGGGGGAAVY